MPKIGKEETSNHNNNQDGSWTLEMMTYSATKIYRLPSKGIFSYEINFPDMQNMNYSLKEGRVGNAR